MKHSFFAVRFEGGGCDRVTWAAIECLGGEGFADFLTGKVASRLYDYEGQGKLRDFSRAGAGPGFRMEWDGDSPSGFRKEKRNWVAGEALAEAFLEEEHEVYFPWNMERDKRHPNATLPGPDIVGFIHVNGSWRFAFGEVKTSSDSRQPPRVAHAMAEQILKIAGDTEFQIKLANWLFYRLKDEDAERKFLAAEQSMHKPIDLKFCLFGILIRGTPATKKDLCGIGGKLGKNLPALVTCSLAGLYLPWPVNRLAMEIGEGDRHE